MSTTILLIEDNESNRYLITFLLKSRGYHIVPAPDGGLGIEHLKAVPEELPHAD